MTSSWENTSLRDAMIILLKDQRLNLSITALAGRVITAEAECNQYFLDNMKGKASRVRVLEFLDHSETIRNTCIVGCQAFFNEQRSENIDDVIAALENILVETVRALKKATINP